MSVSRLLTHGCALWAVMLGLVVLLAGCEADGYSGPTGTVSGTVTLNGEPVPQGCTVVFIADAGHTASGEVGAGGEYSLSMTGKSGQTNAIPAAKYQVCVTPPAGEETSEDYEAMMEQSASGEGQASQEGPAQEEVIPAAFRSTGTSNLAYEVQEGQNTIDIQLEQ